MLLLTCFSALVVSAGLAATLPEVRIAEEDVTFVLYSRLQYEGVYLKSKDVPQIKLIKGLFDASRPTVVLFHGWKDDYTAGSNTFLRDAILTAKDANIIKIDWSSYAAKDYITAKNSVSGAGRIAANFISKINEEFDYSYDKFTIVGFSLGAHAAGHVGKTLKGKIKQIVGLDPAGPLFNAKDTEQSLSKYDAEYVTAIHTNAGVLGITEPVAHSDFYPNGGRRQPGCGLDALGGCAHSRAWEYYAESVVKKAFVAKKCATYDLFQLNICTGSGGMGGFYLDKSLSGTFYLDTNAESPYSKA
ncbi:pancreatic triacylglycerol lipase-like [Cylas formicarius]|uniref:pancreatic triacylglycerol lipase-like n=1 Tax=Cylas formicarius TaxID=197179 RepID=UPI0029589533|nr:pancreatic triacylglycerol lipase-like [Cylas formicarius]